MRDSTASHLPSGEMDANLDDTLRLPKSKKSRLNKIPDPHFHEEVQDDATMEEKKEAVEKIKEVREDDGEKKLEAEIQESFPSEVVVEKDTTKVDNTYELHTSPLKLLGYRKSRYWPLSTMLQGNSHKIAESCLFQKR